MPFYQKSLIHWEAWFPPYFVRQNQPTKLFVWRLKTTLKQKCSDLRPLFSITFPLGFWIFKNIGHLTLWNGGKKTFIRYLKSEHMDRQTDGQTDTQTDISTYRKHRPKGPMLWKSYLGQNLCKILRYFVKKVSNVAILRFLVAFCYTFLNLMLLFVNFLHYLGLLRLLRCFVAN